MLLIFSFTLTPLVEISISKISSNSRSPSNSELFIVLCLKRSSKFSVKTSLPNFLKNSLRKTILWEQFVVVLQEHFKAKRSWLYCTSSIADNRHGNLDKPLQFYFY